MHEPGLDEELLPGSPLADRPEDRRARRMVRDQLARLPRLRRHRVLGLVGHDAAARRPPSVHARRLRGGRLQLRRRGPKQRRPELRLPAIPRHVPDGRDRGGTLPRTDQHHPRRRNDLGAQRTAREYDRVEVDRHRRRLRQRPPQPDLRNVQRGRHHRGDDLARRCAHPGRVRDGDPAERVRRDTGRAARVNPGHDRRRRRGRNGLPRIRAQRRLHRSRRVRSLRNPLRLYTADPGSRAGHPGRALLGHGRSNRQ